MRPLAPSRVNRTFGVSGRLRLALTGRQDRLKFAMRRLVKARPAEDARGRSESAKREPQANQFYLTLMVILFETSGGVNG